MQPDSNATRIGDKLNVVGGETFMDADRRHEMFEDIIAVAEDNIRIAGTCRINQINQFM